MKFNRICVLGLGYIGLPTASTFATHGLKVLGVDISRRVVEILRNGDLHIHELGLRTLVQSAMGSGNLIVDDSLAPADAFIIAVPTPFKDGKRADLSFVVSAAEAIIPFLQPGNLVVLESTSPPGTTINVLAPILERSGLKAGTDFHLAYSPERVLPGQILRELIENDRVVGGVDRASAEAGRDLYAVFAQGEIVLTDATTAEMVKLMENSFRDINIAIANEFSRLAERFGVDVWDAIRIANRHPRVNVLQPGPGVGGHCISVDPWFLVEAAPDLTHLIHTARQVNDDQPGYVVDIIRSVLKGGIGETDGYSTDVNGVFIGKRIAILGLAYKSNVDDLRESPAIEVARKLSEVGTTVKAYDPFTLNTVVATGIQTTLTLEEAIKDADLIALLVAHDPLRNLDPHQVATITKARIIFDGVNGWQADAWKAAGFRYIRLGDGRREETVILREVETPTLVDK